MKNYDFLLAGKVFRLEHCQTLHINSQFLPFQVKGKETDCVVTFQEDKKLVFDEGKRVFADISQEVLLTEEGVIRQYWEAKENFLKYAVNQIAKDGKSARITYLPAFRKAFGEVRNSFSHIGFEELLIYQSRLILHASLINTELGGVLFSGPSGIGKSTQAELWKNHENARIINGDRPIIGVQAGYWKAWGSPYAGSSGYHIQENVPVKAIVMLSQGKENRVEMLSGRQAVSAVLMQVTLNRWNKVYTDRAIDMVMSLVDSVPIYHFECTPDKEAVTFLKKYLKGREV